MWTRLDESTAFREREREIAVSGEIRHHEGRNSCTSCREGERPRTAPHTPEHAATRPLSGAPQNVERRFPLETMVEALEIQPTPDAQSPRSPSPA